MNYTYSTRDRVCSTHHFFQMEYWTSFPSCLNDPMQPSLRGLAAGPAQALAEGGQQRLELLLDAVVRVRVRFRVRIRVRVRVRVRFRVRVRVRVSAPTLMP